MTIVIINLEMKNSKMFAAVFHKNKDNGGEINFKEVEVPLITRDNDVLIEVKSCGICGMDLKILDGTINANNNTILGHEFVGIVQDTGKNVIDLIVGDKVIVDPSEKCGYCIACRRGQSIFCNSTALGITYGVLKHGGLAKYCILPRSALFKLPDDIDLKAATLIEPLSCAIHCHNISNVGGSDNVVIFGAGPMGILIEAVFKQYPIKRLIVIEHNQFRIRKAKKLGADFVINPDTQDVESSINKITRLEGINTVIDTVGSSETFDIALKISAPEANIICFGLDSEAEIRIKPLYIIRYQLKIMGSYISKPEDVLDAIELIIKNKIQVNEIITHQIPLEKIVSDGLGLMKQRDCLKIILYP